MGVCKIEKLTIPEDPMIIVKDDNKDEENIQMSR